MGVLGGLKKTGMTTFNPRLLEVIKVKGNTELLLRISVTSSGNSLSRRTRVGKRATANSGERYGRLDAGSPTVTRPFT